MTEDYQIDPNKIAAEFLKANQDEILGSVKRGFKKFGMGIRVRFTESYTNYLVRVLERYSTAKSFLFRSEAVPLYSFYVPAGLQTPSGTITQVKLAQVTRMSPHFIIEGLGGSGKSLLMRHLLIDCVESKQKTPIFVELRDLNSNDDDLQSACLRALKARGFEVDERYLEIALSAGHFCLMFDGYDELLVEKRSAVLEQLHRLSEHYSKNWIVVSTRPDSELASVEPFSQFTIAPLKIKDAIAIVERLPFDADISERFIAALKRGMFEEHRSFLSNPLLLTIMLLTFSDTAEIPDRLSLFYNQAYESLFNKHDALKSRFQRQHRTDLDIRDFARAFSAFCLLSYDERQFSMCQEDALDLFERAKPLSLLSYDSKDLLVDAEQAVCLLIEDGLEITFAHRSFQEYFVARYIRGQDDEDKRKLIERYSANIRSDEVMSLLYEMDPRSVEDHLILPTIREFRRTTGADGDKFANVHYLRYLSRAFSEIHIEEGRIKTARLNDSDFLERVMFVGGLARRDHNHFQQDITDFDRVRLTDLAVAIHPKGRVNPAALEPDSELVSLMSRIRDFWGIAFGRSLLAFEQNILERQRIQRTSLQQLLTRPASEAAEL